MAEQNDEQREEKKKPEVFLRGCKLSRYVLCTVNSISISGALQYKAAPSLGLLDMYDRDKS